MSCKGKSHFTRHRLFSLSYSSINLKGQSALLVDRIEKFQLRGSCTLTQSEAFDIIYYINLFHFMRSIVEVMKRKAQVPAEKNRPKMFDEFRISTFIILTIAGIINAFGVTIFLFPVKLYDSGISGLSMLLDQITPPQFTLSLFLLLLNIPIFAFGYKKQGASFTIYSVFTVGVYSVMSFLIMNVLPIDVSFISPLAGSDLLLCAIFGGVISGIGSGLTIRFGGAIDGIDVLSVVFAKKIGISIGTFVMILIRYYILCAELPSKAGYFHCIPLLPITLVQRRSIL